MIQHFIQEVKFILKQLGHIHWVPLTASTVTASTRLL